MITIYQTMQIANTMDPSTLGLLNKLSLSFLIQDLRIYGFQVKIVDYRLVIIRIDFILQNPQHTKIFQNRKLYPICQENVMDFGDVTLLTCLTMIVQKQK
jgi:hypothetical protein